MSSHRRKLPAPEAFRRRLAEILADHDMKPSELADIIGLSRAAVSQWMTGSGMPSEENALRAAEVLDEDLEFFMARSDRGSRGLGKKYAHLIDELGKERFDFLAGLPGEELRRIIDAVRAANAPTRKPKKRGAKRG